MLNPFRRIVDFYWRFLVSPIDYARHIGVFVGENSFIATRKWSSEPYLITIGNNVQITSGVAIHTHGGGNSVVLEFQILMYLEKCKSKIGLI